MSCVPAGNRYKLDEEVDFDHSMETDLIQIADLLKNLEMLAPSLGLSQVEINDVYSNNRNPALLRYYSYTAL